MKRESEQRTEQRKQTFQQPTAKNTTNTCGKRIIHTEIVQLICSFFPFLFSTLSTNAIRDELKIIRATKKGG